MCIHVANCASEIATMLRQGPVDALRVGLLTEIPASVATLSAPVRCESSCRFSTFREACFSVCKLASAVALKSAKSGLPHVLVDIGQGLTDFSETAAVHIALDLIITVDTATMHLAGAAGSSGVDDAVSHSGLALALTSRRFTVVSDLASSASRSGGIGIPPCEKFRPVCCAVRTLPRGSSFRPVNGINRIKLFRIMPMQLNRRR